MYRIVLILLLLIIVDEVCISGDVQFSAESLGGYVSPGTYAIEIPSTDVMEDHHTIPIKSLGTIQFAPAGI